MGKTAMHLLLLMFLLGTLLCVSAVTDPLDVTALRALFGALNAPPQLTGWKIDGGDPCGEDSWKGVYCSGQSIISIKIDGLGICGFLGQQLSSFRSLKYLDVSDNCIGGEIPYSLPLNTTSMNFSHNSLSGPIGNVFIGLQYLKTMDLSFNNLSGDLPGSFGTLTELDELYLQENHFTGSVHFLTNITLSILNLENNNFSGILPRQFDIIPQLKIDGNMFQPRHVSSPPSKEDGHSSPSKTPENESADHINIPMNTSNSSGNLPLGASDHNQRSLGRATVAGIICSVSLVALLAAAFSIIRIKGSYKSKLAGSRIISDPDYALPVTDPKVPTEDLDQFLSSSLSVVAPFPPSVCTLRHKRNSRRKSCSMGANTLLAAKLYSASDMLIATNSYNEANLVGEGFSGRVYRAEFSDGQVFVVKKVNMVPLTIDEEDIFLDVVSNMSQLRHQNIILLLGYCVEQGHHILAYEYASNGSLDDVLRFSHDSLHWKDRMKIALGVARALEYMHCRCSPPMAHQNLKATNILLDENLMPHLIDCGLSALRRLIDTKKKASGLPIDCMDYTAPEFGVPGIDESKMDIYSFGVILLQLLTGKMAFDSSRGREGQPLVKWALRRLHDISLLEDMTDPAIKGSVSSKVISRFADIILLCIQPEPEFRPTITEIGDLLVCLIQRMYQHPRRSSAENDLAEVEPESSDVSFKTTLAEFDASPSR